MKLAELENLSAGFVSEQFKEEEVVEEATEEVVDEIHCGKRDDEDLEEGHGMEEGPGMAYKAHEDEEEAAEEEAEEAEEEAGEELEDEAEMEMEEPAEEAEMSISPEEAEVLKSILQKLESAMGEEAAAAPEMELDSEPEMEEEPMMEDAACGEGMKMSRETGKCESEEHPSLGRKQHESIEDDSLQEMVNNIAARVAKRILEQGK
jgi:hypothetical protein